MGRSTVDLPEMLGLVIVLDHLGGPALKVENAAGAGDLGPNILDDAAGVLLGGILPLEDVVVGSHGQ